MYSQHGELRPTSGWDRFISLGHPAKFQLVSRLGRVTARHVVVGVSHTFTALNRGRHLCPAGPPSRWALAHISSFNYFCRFGALAYATLDRLLAVFFLTDNNVEQQNVRKTADAWFIIAWPTFTIYHCVWSAITAHNLITPATWLRCSAQHSTYNWHPALL